MRTWILSFVFLGLIALVGLLLVQKFVTAATPQRTSAATEEPRDSEVGIDAKALEISRRVDDPARDVPTRQVPENQGSVKPTELESRPLEAVPAFELEDLPKEDGPRALAITGFVNTILAGNYADPWTNLETPLKTLRALNEKLWMDPDGGFRSSRMEPIPLSKVASALAKQTPPVVVGCGFLAKMNQLKNPNVVPGHRKLRVPNDPLSIVVRRQSFSLALYLGDYALDVFPVGLGKLSTPTPSGDFEIREIQHLEKLTRKDTAWIRPEDGNIFYFGDPEYPFGKRFLRFAAPFEHYGIHGTDSDAAIGRGMSHGCVRMKNADVETLSSLVDPAGPARIRVRIE